MKFKKIKKLFKKGDSTVDYSKEIIRNHETYIENGMIPWTEGYVEYKQHEITKKINDKSLLESIKNKNLPSQYGYRLDDRIVEYPWLFSKIKSGKERVLDAGSTLNFNYILAHPVLHDKNLSIFTFEPEKDAFFEKRISYVYGDLRDLPFKDGLFNLIVSQSTIEHIDMDNSMYGYDIKHNKETHTKSYEYLIAIDEMVRVLKNDGNLLLTFPFGKFEHHGFFQQFDEEMLGRITAIFEKQGRYTSDFFKYEEEGWEFSNMEQLKNTVSYNPHTGKGKLEDNAAHSRGIACLHFKKS